MPPVDTSLRPFTPGTTGWSASDLDDPQIESLWFQGQYEIIDGVLTNMAPAYFSAGETITNLVYVCKEYLRNRKMKGSFGQETDIIIDESRVLRADSAFMTPEDKKRQQLAASAAKRRDLRRTRILVPPTLIIESISPGHERHDEQTKFRWYAEFRVPNYWILDALNQSLNCWILDGGSYRQDVVGQRSEQVRPGLFPGLVISLVEIWEE